MSKERERRDFTDGLLCRNGSQVQRLTIARIYLLKPKIHEEWDLSTVDLNKQE